MPEDSPTKEPVMRRIDVFLLVTRTNRQRLNSQIPGGGFTFILMDLYGSIYK